jgi:FeS assembly protein IscX
MSLTWHHSRQIGALLFERYDTLNPRTVQLGDLRKWVLDLEDFEDRADGGDEKALDAIRQAWYDEWKDEFGGKREEG